MRLQFSICIIIFLVCIQKIISDKGAGSGGLLKAVGLTSSFSFGSDGVDFKVKPLSKGWGAQGYGPGGGSKGGGKGWGWAPKKPNHGLRSKAGRHSGGGGEGWGWNPPVYHVKIPRLKFIPGKVKLRGFRLRLYRPKLTVRLPRFKWVKG